MLTGDWFGLFPVQHRRLSKVLWWLEYLHWFCFISYKCSAHQKEWNISIGFVSPAINALPIKKPNMDAKTVWVGSSRISTETKGPRGTHRITESVAEEQMRRSSHRDKYNNGLWEIQRRGNTTVDFEEIQHWIVGQIQSWRLEGRCWGLGGCYVAGSYLTRAPTPQNRRNQSTCY